MIIPTFSSDPMSYKHFIRAFKDNVERVISDDASRLARLAQQCEGKAAHVIECCMLMPPELGYPRARELKPGHGTYRCQERLRCKVQGCQRHHVTLLHGSIWPSSTTSTDTSGAGQSHTRIVHGSIWPSSTTSTDTSGAGQSHTRIVQAGASQDTSTPTPSSPAVHSQGSEAQGQGVMCNGHVIESAVQKVALPIVAVKVKATSSNSCVDTYALLDTGASWSFCTEGLFNALGIEGHTKPIAVSTLTGYTYDNATRIADL